MCASADFNSDGVINTLDLFAVQSVFTYDLSGDSMVDLRDAPDNHDMAILQGCFLQPPVGGCAAADFNTDGVINGLDLGLFNTASVFDLNTDGVAQYFSNTPPQFLNSGDIQAFEHDNVGVYVQAQDVNSDAVTYTTPVVPAFATVASVLMGDVNSDGVVDNTDVTAATDYIAQNGNAVLNIQDSVFDLNNDRTIDQLDVDSIQSLIGAQRTGFFVSLLDSVPGTFDISATATDEHGDSSAVSIHIMVFDLRVFNTYAAHQDVLLITNDNAPISGQIADYFAQARNIGPEHIVHIAAATTETITRQQFTDTIRGPIEQFLTSNGIEDRINYIVTTKGVPLRISGSSLDRASVDSELTLILSPSADMIGSSGSVQNPYVNAEYPFSRRTYGVYLVTRLTGYTFDDVVQLIDNAAGALGATGRFVFDVDPTKDSSPGFKIGNDWMRAAAPITTAAGYDTLLDETTTFLTGEVDVLGYASWGSNDANDTNNAIVGFGWVSGALAETYVSTSARTFTAPPVYGQSLIADLIAEHVTGAKGYVYEPYLAAIAHPDILFDRYTKGYNLADSYYMASTSMSWMDVVVGDPKTRLSNAIAVILPGDFDGDGDVDLADYAFFAGCQTPPGGGVLAGCDATDIDGDGDTDLADFTGFTVAFTGAL